MMSGKAINDACTVCKQGKLKPVTVLQGNLIHGRIDRVACDHCQLCFESRDRGDHVDRALEKQAMSFENPVEKPSCCPVCRGDLTSAYPTRARFLYCAGSCYAIAWVEFPLREYAEEQSRQSHGMLG